MFNLMAKIDDFYKKAQNILSIDPWFQTALNYFYPGINLKEDGKLGPLTQNALNKFKVDHQLSPNASLQEVKETMLGAERGTGSSARSTDPGSVR